MAKRRGTRETNQTTLDFDAGTDPFARDEPAPPELPKAPAPETEIPADVSAPPSSPTLASPLLESEAIHAGLGESLRDLVDLDTWQTNPDPGELFRNLGEQARRNVEREKARRAPLRELLRQRCREMPNPPPYAGLHRVPEADLEQVARGYLYNGLTEAVCGDFVAHETVPLTLAQAGICLVGYNGRLDQWHHRIIRKELAISLPDPVAEAEAVLQMRHRMAAGGFNRLHQLSELARRGLVSFMERKVMLTQCPGKWRLGYGVPVPLDLLTGMGNMELLSMSLDLMLDLLLGDARWVWVAHRMPEPGLDMLASALEPLEFCILMRLHPRLADQVDTGRYTPQYQVLVDRFVDEVGPKVVLGAFRAGALCPPRFFVAHEDRVYTAALIAMADALPLQPVGMPALLQLARAQCRVGLGMESFEQAVQQAYREAGGEEWFYRGEIR